MESIKDVMSKIKALFESGYTCSEIAKKFDISESSVRAIVYANH
jgi:DNA-binding CsgD family transcriptional regulator